MKVRHFSQPNLLAGKELVPEFFQEQPTPDNLADALGNWFDRPRAGGAPAARVRRDPRHLRRGGAERAASEIAALLTAWTAQCRIGRSA